MKFTWICFLSKIRKRSPYLLTVSLDSKAKSLLCFGICLAIFKMLAKCQSIFTFLFSLLWSLLHPKPGLNSWKLFLPTSSSQGEISQQNIYWSGFIISTPPSAGKLQWEVGLVAFEHVRHWNICPKDSNNLQWPHLSSRCFSFCVKSLIHERLWCPLGKAGIIELM